MYTQCANCETIFQLSAEVLRTAGGQVRCGRCGEVFNALARLAEDADAFTVHESPLDMETLADQILGSAAPPGADESAPAAITAAPAATPAEAPAAEPDDLAQADVEFARLQVLESSMDTLLEFTLPPGELDRVFVDSLPGKAPPPAAKVPAEAHTRNAGESPSAGTTIEEELARALETPDAHGRTRAVATAIEAPSDRRGGMDVDDKVWRDVLAGFEEAQLPQIGAPPRRDLPRPAWIAAALLLAAALIAQIALTHRGLPAWRFGHAGPSAANLSVYQLRQWGVTGDPAARGTLRVRASILNTAAQPQPYPLLRLTLANRFGNRIGTRDFEPAEYLGKLPARMLAPAERVDATLDILDPGKEAEGFEIDVCLKVADQKISCAADAAAQSKQ